jgi:outer membrane cobalamin receptor
MKPDSTAVKTVLSDSLGNFSISVDTGAYILVYTNVGYHPYHSPEISVGNSVITELPAVFLSRDKSQLAGVTVFGRRPVIETMADGFVYNAENDVTIAAGNVIDVLRKIPMVSVTPDGAPSVRGSTNVRVFIDNKPSSVYANSIAEALQLIPSEDIAKIEIITHPSSKYDAEGSDAVINIITKKRRYNGFNGDLRANIGIWRQDLNNSLKLRSGYWILNFDAGLYRSDYEAGYRLIRSVTKQNFADRFEQQREWDSRQNTKNTSLTVIRILDSLSTLNLGYRFRNSSSFEMAEHQTQLFSANAMSDAFTRNIPTISGNEVHTITAGYSGTSRNKKQEYNLLAALFRHSGTDGYNLQQLRNDIVDYREKSEGMTANRELTLQVDFVKHFNQLSKLETGIKTVWRDSKVESLIDIYNASQDKFIRDNIRSNIFNSRRNVNAAYISYTLAIKKWQWRAGLRLEQTHQHTVFKDTILQVPGFKNLLPNILTRYTINQKNSMAYSYTTRITRPYIFFLNPNINFIDSFNISYGNPNLGPEVMHIHTLDYNYTNRSLFIGISIVHTRIQGAIDQIRLLRPDRVSEITWRNVGSARNWSISSSLRFNPNKLTLGGTITAMHVNRESPALNLATSGWLGQLSFNASYKFKKGYTLESYVYYETRSINLQQTRSYYLFYNLLLSKQLLGNKLNITARFDGFMSPWFYRSTEIDNSSFYQLTSNRSINRYLRLAISWKFGKQDLRTPSTRNVESND